MKNYSKEYIEMLQRMMPPAQRHVYDTFLAHAHEFTLSEFAASKKIARRYKTRLKACYANCARIASKQPALRYYSGIATNLIPVAHAWLVDESGAVIDPTYCLLNDEREVHYFGLHVPPELLLLPKNDFEPDWLPIVEWHERHNHER